MQTPNKYVAIEYVGPLAEPLSEYVVHKRTLGYKCNSEAKKFASLDKFSISFGGDKNVMSREMVLAWIQKKPNEKENNHRRRVLLTVQLAKFMINHGWAAYVPVPPPQRTNIMYIPHIYSNSELRTIFDQTDSIAPWKAHPYKHHVIPLLFRLLYGCGLRVSEALYLKVKDVDTDLGILSIYEAKFNKDRLVPLSPSLVDRCREFKRTIHTLSSPTDYFFLADDRGLCSIQSIYITFRKLIWQAGISHGGKGKGPRIHDFRHTFAVHCLRNWVQAGYDITSAIPVLAAYLGHTCLSGTQYYLRLTAELFPDITKTMDDKFGDTIPEILEGEVIQFEGY